MHAPVPRFQAAIFDMDGLLIDSERAIMNAWIAEATGAGLSLTEADYIGVIGRALPQALAHLGELLGGDHHVQRLRPGVVQRLAALPHYPLKPGAQDVLHALRELGVPCAVASSTAIGEVRLRLGRCGVDHYFGAMAGGDEVHRGKPDPAVYLLAAQRLGVEPAQCLAFEDSSTGARAARAAGMAVTVVPDLVPPEAAPSFAVLASLMQAVPSLGHWFDAASRNRRG